MVSSQSRLCCRSGLHHKLEASHRSDLTLHFGGSFSEILSVDVSDIHMTGPKGICHHNQKPKTQTPLYASMFFVRRLGYSFMPNHPPRGPSRRPASADQQRMHKSPSTSHNRTALAIAVTVKPSVIQDLHVVPSSVRTPPAVSLEWALSRVRLMTEPAVSSPPSATDKA